MRTAAAFALLLFATACAQMPAEEAAKPPGETVAFRMQQTEVLPPLPPEQQVATQAEPAAPAPQAIPDADAAPLNLWVRVRKGFAKNDIDNRLVRNWEQWYSSRPEYMARMMDQAGRFLFHVVEEVERRNMPMEIALLPMIESAYNPTAYSRSHASGIWQFIPSTGRLYGLQQDWYYDGRRDIVAATGAALDYLQKLHTQFNDWDHALAAYNWGEGAVERAIARNRARGRPTDYESLRMPAETRNYLPKLQAVKNIVADPERFGVTLPMIPNEPYFATTTVERHIDLEVAAKLAEISVDEFRFLNPAHNKPVINANSAETIVLPKEKLATFLTNLNSYEEPLATWQAYKVKPGESAQRVAAKFGISVDELRRINKLTRRYLYPGQALLVPVQSGAEPQMPALPAPRATRRSASTQKAAAKKKPAAKTAKTPATPAKSASAKPKKPGSKINVADTH